ncbi:MAG: DNA translocase FtsK 4TM domain-containing protein [Chloroflexi bacterium]|nr:DNA translocase FtsK 4TM domain-containing protein [Chloroflexota bacterium]
MPAKKSQKKQGQQGVPITLDRTLQKEILGVLLIALGGVTALALLSITKGSLSEAWSMFLRRIFGWGAYPMVVVLLLTGLLLLWEDLRKYLSIHTRSIVGLELLFIALLGLSHLFLAPEKAFTLAERGQGGGYIGWAIGYFLTAAVGRGVSFLLLSLAVCVSLGLLLSPYWDKVLLALGGIKTRLQNLPPPAPPTEVVQTPQVVLKEKRRPQREPSQPAPITKPRAEVSPALVSTRRTRRERGLPPLALLNGSTAEPYGDADVRYKKQIIEETLASFGVPVRVVEINQGPTVTQFGVEPGVIETQEPDGQIRRRKVRVNRIMALQDDLALALAAAPIRIEAPVPGRSVVGIEVPNTTPSLVGLRSVMESRAFRSIDSKLRIALGQDVAGQPVAADLAQMPHLLIAGATGSGKSVCINSITACLLFNNTPEDLQLLMVDPKMVELTTFNGVPHLVAPVVTDVEEVVRALQWVTRQMDERYRLFSETGVRNIDFYNQLMDSRGQAKLPYMVILIDELADLMVTASDEIERSICRIAQLARATGIHLVIATQRPSVDIITGLIKANFPARISFAVTSQIDSRVILDTAGAEKLLGRGDMLYMPSDSSKLIRLQGCFVSDEELERLVNFWREKIDWVVPQAETIAPWHDVDLDEEVADELLEQAIELARGRSSISTSFIQRRLRIGYPRAARLIDQLEELGIVGPAENAGRSRKVLLNEDGFQEEESDGYESE